MQEATDSGNEDLCGTVLTAKNFLNVPRGIVFFWHIVGSLRCTYATVVLFAETINVGRRPVNVLGNEKSCLGGDMHGSSVQHLMME
jgi:hypothetical protein